RLGSSVGIPLWSAGSAPQAAVEISPNDSGGLRGLSLTSLVAGMASSGTARFVKPARISFNRRATASFVALAEPQILPPKQIDFAILFCPGVSHPFCPSSPGYWPPLSAKPTGRPMDRRTKVELFEQ